MDGLRYENGRYYGDSKGSKHIQKMVEGSNSLPKLPTNNHFHEARTNQPFRRKSMEWVKKKRNWIFVFFLCLTFNHFFYSYRSNVNRRGEYNSSRNSHLFSHANSSAILKYVFMFLFSLIFVVNEYISWNITACEYKLSSEIWKIQLHLSFEEKYSYN